LLRRLPLHLGLVGLDDAVGVEEAVEGGEDEDGAALGLSVGVREPEQGAGVDLGRAGGPVELRFPAAYEVDDHRATSASRFSTWRMWRRASRAAARWAPTSSMTASRLTSTDSGGMPPSSTSWRAPALGSMRVC